MNTPLPPDAGTPEDPVDRLRAADPAAGIDADVTALEAAVRARIAAAESSATITALDPARRSRRPARRLSVAAAVAGVAVIGSGAFALGRHTGSTTPAAPAISLAAPEAAAGAAQRGVASSGAGVAGSVAQPAPYGLGTTRTVFSSPGLAGAAGTAQAWTYDSAAAFSRAKAAAMATALGMSGTPELASGVWTVGATDGTGPRLQLQPDATVDVSYEDPTNNPYGCAGGVVKGSTSSPGEVAGASGPMPTVAPQVCVGSSHGPAPSGADAIARTRALIAAAGLDPQSYEYQSNETGIATITSVTAWAVVDGQRTGQAWNVTLTDRGVQSVWGQLAPVVTLGTYPVVGPQEAVTRLGDARFDANQVGVYSAVGGVGVAVPGSVSSGLVAPAIGTGSAVAPSPVTTASGDTGPSGTPTLPPAPAPGSRVSWPVQHVTITTARLGLAPVRQTDGSVVLAPAYALSDGTGRTWSVIAVAESALDMTPVG
ncbi:hypothetical protein GALL_403880 [mine drainage metagenome]|uniref:Uncharacterized protein n=1 Tax=mine drainage metagenome TaxID=410659 RepID=A0A1J5Q2J2_9ZZZZ